MYFIKQSHTLLQESFLFFNCFQPIRYFLFHLLQSLYLFTLMETSGEAVGWSLLHCLYGLFYFSRSLLDPPFLLGRQQVALWVFVDFPFLFPSSCYAFPSSTKQTVPDTRASAGLSQIAFINFILSPHPNINFTIFLNVIFIRKITDNAN